MTSYSRLFVGLVLLGLSACASVPMAPANFDAAAKSFTPPPLDRAHVYVYRNESFGSAVKMGLRLDGVPAGSTVAKTFALLPVRPGVHTLLSDAENDSEVQVVARPGEIIFVWQEVKMGFLSARSRLQLVHPSVGMPGVAECALIGYPPPPLPPPLPLPPPPAMPATPATPPVPPAASTPPALPAS